MVSGHYKRKYKEKMEILRKPNCGVTEEETLAVYMYTYSSDLARSFHEACYKTGHITCKWRQFYKNLVRFIEKYNRAFHINNDNIKNLIFDNLYHATCAKLKVMKHLFFIYLFFFYVIK